MSRLEQPTLEFFFDYASPFSYLADTQLPGIAKRAGATVLYLGEVLSRRIGVSMRYQRMKEMI